MCWPVFRSAILLACVGAGHVYSESAEGPGHSWVSLGFVAPSSCFALVAQAFLPVLLGYSSPCPLWPFANSVLKSPLPLLSALFVPALSFLFPRTHPNLIVK